MEAEDWFAEVGGEGGKGVWEWSRSRMSDSRRIAAVRVAPMIANNGQDDAFRGVADSGGSLLSCLKFGAGARIGMDRVRILE